MNDIHRRDLMNACHHEAGHLVALTLLGGDGFMEVYPTHTRNLKKEAAFTGKTRLVKSTTHPADMKIVALAGVVAETVLHEPEVQGFEILESLMYESLLLSPSDADIAGEYTEEDVEAALCLVRENWQRVVVLAEAEAAKFSGGALQTQKSPVGAGPICKPKSNEPRNHTKLSPRMQRLLKALMHQPQSSRDLMLSLPCNNPPEYIRTIRNRYGLSIPVEHIKFTTIDGRASQYGMYSLTPDDRVKAAALLEVGA